MYRTSFLHKGLPKVKSDINSVDVHPQWSDDSHPVDGALVGAGSLGPQAESCKGQVRALQSSGAQVSSSLNCRLRKSLESRGHPLYSDDLCHSISFHRAAML